MGRGEGEWGDKRKKNKRKKKRMKKWRSSLTLWRSMPFVYLSMLVSLMEHLVL